VLSGSELAGLTYAAPGPGATAAYIAPNIVLTTPDTTNSFTDTGMVLINNGYDGVTLSTLNALIISVSFNLAGASGGNGNFAYWDVLLSNPTNPLNTIIINAFGDNVLGANPFNQGSSVFASASAPPSVFPFGTPWAAVAGVSLDGTPLGSWNVTQLSISVGGQGTNDPQLDVISSITLPGTLVLPAPEPASMLILGVGLAGLGMIRRRKKAG
jgi:hypothetical protein